MSPIPCATSVIDGITVCRCDAAPQLEPPELERLIVLLQDEGALLEHQENAHLIRPANLQQLDSVSPH